MAEEHEIDHLEYTKDILPEERKACIERGLAIIQEARKHFSAKLNGFEHSSAWPEKAEIHLQEQLEKEGGPIRLLLEKNLEEYSLGDYWYTKYMNKPEAEILAELFAMLPVEPDEIRAFDIGSGTGRTSELAINAINQLNYDNEEAATKFTGNLQAIDLMPRFVQETKDTLEPLGVPEDNVHQGDFADLPEELKQEQFHAAWILMNTLFYCTSEEDLGKVLSNVEKSLANGGMFLFDTMKLTNHEGIPNQDVLCEFDDLKNLYSVLARIYRENHIDPRINSFDVRTPFQIKRYPICDRMTGGEFRTREVLTVEYVEHVLNKMESDLTLVTPEPMERNINGVEDDEAERLGMGWIKDNGAEEWLRKEIAYRLKQVENSEITPLYGLDINQRDKQKTDLNLENPLIDSALKDVAIGMAKNYTKQYYVFQKRTNLDN